VDIGNPNSPSYIHIYEAYINIYCSVSKHIDTFGYCFVLSSNTFWHARMIDTYRSASVNGRFSGGKLVLVTDTSMRRFNYGPLQSFGHRPGKCNSIVIVAVKRGSS
jgi:hypothetical protein